MSFIEALTPLVLWATTLVLILHDAGMVPVAMTAGSAGVVSGAYFTRWCHRRAQADHDEQLLSQIIDELEARA